jgi:hypothetical protein
MALKKLPKRLPENDPRREGQETTYQASRGGWLKKSETPKAKRSCGGRRRCGGTCPLAAEAHRGRVADPDPPLSPTGEPVTRRGKVEIYLDGPREREFDLPDNWCDMTDEERSEFVRPVKESLRDDSTAWEIKAACSCGCEYC